MASRGILYKEWPNEREFKLQEGKDTSNFTKITLDKKETPQEEATFVLNYCQYYVKCHKIA